MESILSAIYYFTIEAVRGAHARVRRRHDVEPLPRLRGLRGIELQLSRYGPRLARALHHLNHSSRQRQRT